MNKLTRILVKLVIGGLTIFPLIATAQVFSQSQVMIPPYGGPGFIVSTTTGVGGKLQATTTPFFANFYFGNATGTTFSLPSLSAGGAAINSTGRFYSGATTTAGTGLSYSGNAFNVNTTQNITNLSNLSSNGLVKTSSGSGSLSIATNGADYTLITALTCSAGQFFQQVTAAGVFTCGTPAGTTYTATFPIQVTGSVISSLFSTTTLSGMTQGNLYVGSGGIFQTSGTSTPTVSAPITYSGTLGQFMSGVSGAFGCTTAAAGVTGCLSGTDYSTFTAKQGSGFQITTTTPLSISNLSYFTGVTPTSLGGVATTSVTCTGNTTCTSFTAIGASPITINSTGGSGSVTSISNGGGLDFSVSPITTTGTITAQVGTSSVPSLGQLAYWTGVATPSTIGSVATGTVSNGTGISVTAGQSVIGSGLTITNTGVTSLGNGTGTTCSGTAPGTCNVNTTQNITTLSNLTTAGTLNNTASGVLYSTGTSTITNGSGIAYTGTMGSEIGGVSGTLSVSGLSGTNFSNVTANTVFANATGVSAAPAFVATSTFFGTPTPGTILAFLNGQNTFVATTTFSSGLTYLNGNVTNTGVTSNVAGTGISISGATGAVTITNSGVTSIAGTANQITTSGSTGSVTLSFPNHVIFPNDFLVTNSTTTNATTTGSVYFTGVTASRPLYVDSTGKLGSAGTGTSGNCVQWAANNTLGDAGAACGTSGGSSFGKSWEIDALKQLAPTTTIAVSIPTWLSINDQTFAYGSTTGGSTIVGLLAGGNSATTTDGGDHITAIGYSAMAANAFNGVDNTAVGYTALAANTSADRSTAVGSQALVVSTGADNTAMGANALLTNVSGGNNVAIGSGSEGLVLTGNLNTTVGFDSGGAATTGSVLTGITALGADAGIRLTTGADYNTLTGYLSGNLITTGSENTLVGASKNQNNLSTGNGNIGIGAEIFFPSATNNFQLNIGNLIFGTLPATTTAFSLPTSGAIGIGTSSPFAKFAIHANNGDTARTLFAIGSSTQTATTTLVAVTNTGNFLIGTTTNSVAGSTFAEVISNSVQSLGGLLINTWTNVTNAFSIVNAAGTTVFNVDTTATNPFLGVGATTTPWGTLSVTGDGTDPLFAVATSSNQGLPNFEIDVNGHEVTSGIKPICTTNCTMLAGNDNAFRINTAAAVSSETVTFTKSWGVNAPICQATEGGNTATPIVIAASTTPTAIVLTNGSLSSKDIDVVCLGIQ